ncbi:LysM peptidoglycan-binding domain-containing protein [Ferviditalea candida]|uniref:LysM peptidoglycan-binding domain-containing protein n=1 Tax=Ferviditalea candida TaxID=3108399 RepID=A0ABU5ZCG6_9BACL|nr:LysM peptidoglycan-binding domain-containing protein [Paenibacillaceae bacterium T2]
MKVDKSSWSFFSRSKKTNDVRKFPIGAFSLGARKLGGLLIAVALLLQLGAEPVLAEAPSSLMGQRLIDSGQKYIGTPYQFGANPDQTATFDCSSFTRRVFLENGMTLPRTSSDQYQLGTAVNLDQAQIGDLLFFQNPANPGVADHVGIYQGNLIMLNATVSKGVKSTDISTDYWMSRLIGVKRVLPKMVQVRYGDTLWKISIANNVSISQLMNWNKLAPDFLVPGQLLFISNPDLTAKSGSNPGKIHIVQPGDLLWKIALTYNVTVDNLRTWNQLTGDMIYPGQALYLQAPSEPYTVQPGDTLWLISQKKGVSVAKIKEAAHLSSDFIYPGQILPIPLI